MDLSLEQLESARRDWLAGFRRAYEAQPAAGPARDLAQAEWKCGEYESALNHFLKARDFAPEQTDHHLSLVRAAASLARWDLLSAALDAGLSRHPDAALLALHAAQWHLRQGPHAALAAIAAYRQSHPLCDFYATAFECLEGSVPPTARDFGSPDLNARWQGFCWLYERGDPDRFVGFPTQVLERALAAASVPGLILECGVYFGRSLRLIAERAGKNVHGFDSFRGLPEAWNEREPAGSYSTAGRIPEMPATVELHVGWFEDTLPPFFARHRQPVRLLHVDCDLYSSTRTVLESAAAALVPGTVLLFDDFIGFPGYEAHEFRAFHEFAAERDLRWSVIAGALVAREVAVLIQPS